MRRPSGCNGIYGGTVYIAWCSFVRGQIPYARQPSPRGTSFQFHPTFQVRFLVVVVQYESTAAAEDVAISAMSTRNDFQRLAFVLAFPRTSAAV